MVHSLFLDIDDPAAYFLTVSVFSAHHHAMGSVQYSQCPLVRIMAKPPSSGGMGKGKYVVCDILCVYACLRVFFACFSSFHVVSEQAYEQHIVD